MERIPIEDSAAGFTVAEKNQIQSDIKLHEQMLVQITEQIMQLRKDLNDLVLLLYGTSDVPAVTTNENTEEK